MIFRGCVYSDTPFLFGKKLSKNSFNNLPKFPKNNTDLCNVIEIQSEMQHSNVWVDYDV